MRTFRVNNIIAIVIAIAILVTSQARSAEPQVNIAASVDNSEITIGDVVALTITVRHPENVEVSIPPIGEKMGEFLIRDISMLQARIENGEKVQETIYLITTYFSGDLTVPPIEVTYKYKDENGETLEKKIESDPVTLNVKRTAPKDATDIIDIKGPVTIPFDWRPYALWIGVTLITAALVILGVFYFKRIRPAARAAAKIAPPLPPHEMALKELGRIEAMGLVEAGELDRYYDLVTDAMRRYLGARYNFNAIEMTTDEIIPALDGRLRRLDLKDTVAAWLRESDLVKFAKGESSAERARKLIEETRRIVKVTAPGAAQMTAQE